MKYTIEQSYNVCCKNLKETQDKLAEKTEQVSKRNMRIGELKKQKCP
jgi:hypothetical protein